MSRSTKRWRFAVLAVAVGLLAIAIWQKRVWDAAQNHLDAGRAALRNDDPVEARRRFDLHLEIRPESNEGTFFAAKAARRSGDLNAAKAYLKRAESAGRATGDIELERALILAQSGYFPEAEPTLVLHVRDGGDEAAEILSLLVPAYMGQFRIVEADGLSAKWVDLRPSSPQAWALRADILERVQKKEDALVARRQLVLLAPDDRAERFHLARLILETRQPPGEAAGHLEWLVALEPENRAVQVELAACREAQGRPDDAAEILDRVIAGPAPNAKAFHLRGRVELNRGRAAGAVAFLRRGIDLDPSDVELLYSHFLAVQQTGTPDEIREAERRWKSCDADLRRVGVLARIADATPRDPEPRREMGELFLRNGRTVEGLRWLESALRLDPQHAPTHKVLAAHYEKTGDVELARRHAAGATPPVPK